MSHSEFVTWKAKAIAAMGLRIDEAAFLDFWEKELADVDLIDAVVALSATQSDLRVVKAPPRDRLPIILDYARDARVERERSQRTPRPAKAAKPLTSEAWDRRMVELGAIDEKEFKRRQSERKAVKS